MTDGGAVSVAPTVYASPSGVNPLLYGTVGLGADMDLTVGTGLEAGWKPGGATGGLDAVARFSLSDDLILAVHGGMTFTETSALVGPELHWARSFGPLDLTANAGWRANTAGGGSVVAVGFAPELWVHERLSLYCELDPTLDLGPEALPTPGMTVVPGLSASLTADGAHALSFGVQIPVGDPAGEVSGGLWYSAAFDIGRTQSVASRE